MTAITEVKTEGGDCRGNGMILYSIWNPFPALLRLHASKLLEAIYRNLSKIIQDPINSKPIQRTSKKPPTGKWQVECTILFKHLGWNRMRWCTCCCLTTITTSWNSWELDLSRSGVISLHRTCLTRLWKMNERADVPRRRRDWDQMLRNVLRSLVVFPFFPRP